MDENRQFNRFIVSVILIVVAYYILGFFIKFVVFGLIGLVIFRIFLEYQRK